MNRIEPAASPLLGLSQRLPPSNLQAEQALLGALLANNKAYERVSDFLAPDHFADPIHGRIFQAIARRIEAGQLADAVTLKAEFEHSGMLEEVGGTAYLAQLLVRHGRHHQRRRIRPRGPRRLAAPPAHRHRRDRGQQRLRRASRSWTAASRSRRPSSRCSSSPRAAAATARCIPFERALTEAIHGAERAFHRSGHVSGLTTGLRDLDTKTGGLHPSDLVILAGRPGMGKTALATKIAFGAAKALLAEARASDPNALAEAHGRDLLAGNERGAARHPPAGARKRASPAIASAAAISARRISTGSSQVSREIAALPIQIDDTPAHHPVRAAHPLPAAASAPRGWRWWWSTICS